MSFTNSTVLIHVESGEYPLSVVALKARHTNISFGSHIDTDFIKSLGYEEVVDSVAPVGDVVTEVAPVKGSDGVWRQQWLARDYTAEELGSQLEALRQDALVKINDLLVNTLSKGTPFNFDALGGEGNVQHVQMRDADRTNILGLKQEADRLVASTDPVIPLRTFEDNTLMLTPAQVLSISWGVSAGYQEVMMKSWQLKDAVRNAKTLAELPVIPDDFEPTLRVVE